jgi:hypothetical protein
MCASYRMGQHCCFNAAPVKTCSPCDSVHVTDTVQEYLLRGFVRLTWRNSPILFVKSRLTGRKVSSSSVLWISVHGSMSFSNDLAVSCILSRCSANVKLEDCGALLLATIPFEGRYLRPPTSQCSIVCQLGQQLLLVVEL